MSARRNDWGGVVVLALVLVMVESMSEKKSAPKTKKGDTGAQLGEQAFLDPRLAPYASKLSDAQLAVLNPLVLAGKLTGSEVGKLFKL